MNPPCPVCQQQPSTCAHNRNGICRLLPEQVQTHLDGLYRYRVEHTPYQPPQIEDYNQLPFSLAHTHFEWRMRSADVNHVLRLLQNRTQQTILEIGAWNGWLTQHLARAGHHVTALSYSADAVDGLGSKQYYDVGWHSVQMDMSDLSSIQGHVDAVVINHGLHLFPDPVAYVQSVQKLLKPGGVLIILGMTFYRDPSARQQVIAQQQARCRELTGVPYLLRPSRGYMDLTDLHALHRSGISIKHYHHLWRSTLKTWVKRTAPMYRWGLYHNA